MSNYTRSLTGKTKGRRQVNPTYSGYAPAVKPANGGKQVNPTPSASKSQTAIDAHVSKKPVNRTYAATNNENSKGGKNKSATARPGKPLATKANPRPMFKAMLAGNKGKVMNVPTRNIPGSVGTGKKTNSAPTKGHALKAHNQSLPTNNTSAPYGPNAGAGPVHSHSKGISVSRLKSLGY